MSDFFKWVDAILFTILVWQIISLLFDTKKKRKAQKQSEHFIEEIVRRGEPK